MAKHSDELVRKAFELKFQGKTLAAICRELSIGETNLTSWWSGEHRREIVEEFFPEGKPKHTKNRKKTKKDIEQEAKHIIKENRLDITFLRASWDTVEFKSGKTQKFLPPMRHHQQFLHFGMT